MKEVYRIKIVSVIFLLFTAFSALAQRHVVTGKVTDAAASPLPGVNVIIKGTTIGTTTDADGIFTLEAGNDEVLVFSFIGYKTSEMLTGNQTQINLALEEDMETLQEVVVVGYGEQKKTLVTGAISKVEGEDFIKKSATMTLEALQGKLAGVQITPTSGQPGSGFRVIVRGMGTINNAQPLYVVDGVQTGDISYLNTNDIESVEVLKDAASAAIYGSQAANGVVLITTKKGKAGTMEISFDGYYGVQNLARKVDLLNSREYAVIMNETAINSGKLPYFTSDEISAMGEGTDWIDEMVYKNAVTQNYNLGVSGGSDASVYSIALAYTGQDGIMGGPDVSHYDRYNFRVNSEHKLLHDKISLGENLTFAYSNSRGVAVGNQYSNSLRGAFEVSPFLPMYDDNGEYLNNTSGAGVMYNNAPWVPWNPDEANPYAQMVLNSQNRNNSQKWFGNVYAAIEPIKNLKFRSTFGIDFTSGEGRSYSPIYELSIYAVRTNDQASQSLSKGLGWQWDNVLTYDLNIGDHALTAMAGVFAYSSNGSWMNISNADLIRPSLDYAWIGSTTNTDLTRLSFGGGPYDESKLQSYFGRLSYNYKEKYLVNASYRADGSSRFEKSNRWGYFPSISAGWVLSSEPFFTTQTWVNFLKIRGSFGQVGNQSVPAFQYLAPISMGNANYYFGSADFDASGNTVGAYPSRLPNAEIKWETSEQKNIGFDAGFLGNRLGVEVELYNKTTKDWLIQAPVLATAGAEAPFINGGNVKNTGVELSLRWKDETEGVKYSITGVASRNQNEVTEVPTPDGFIAGDGNGLYNNAPPFYRRAQTGFPIGYFWGWKTNGIFQNEAEVSTYTNSEGTVIQPNAEPGDLRYMDQDGNGVINEEDKVMIGDPNPEYVLGFSLNAGYKGFDLNISAHGVMGNTLAQSYRNYARALPNYTTEILGRWHGEGTSNTIPRVTETNINYLPSDIFIKDGDFLRIDNITLGYNFGGLLNAKLFKQARVFVSLLNAFTFTKYNGMDPDVGFGLQSGSSGTDLGYYPRARTAMAGLNIKF